MIRPAKVTEARSIAEIHVKTWQDAYEDILPDNFLSGLSVDQRMDSWTQQIEDEDTKVYVSETEEGISGFIACGACRDKEYGSFSEIYAIYVSPEFQNMGIGKRLAKFFLDSIYDSCSLWVLTDNSSTISFYKQLGFEFDGTTKNLSICGEDIEESRYIIRANNSCHTTTYKAQ